VINNFQISDSCKRNLALRYFKFLEFFNKSPVFKKGESIEEYVLRVDKKYALRRINFELAICPKYNIEAIGNILKTEKKAGVRKLLKLMRSFAIDKIRFELLKKQILEK